VRDYKIFTTFPELSVTSAIPSRALACVRNARAGAASRAVVASSYENRTFLECSRYQGTLIIPDEAPQRQSCNGDRAWKEPGTETPRNAVCACSDQLRFVASFDQRCSEPPQMGKSILWLPSRPSSSFREKLIFLTCLRHESSQLLYVYLEFPRCHREFDCHPRLGTFCNQKWRFFAMNDEPIKKSNTLYMPVPIR